MTLTSRTMDVLGAFTPHRGRMRLAELSDAVGLPLTTTHRIVGDLLAWGALERGDDGLLQIGLRLWETAALAPRGNVLRDVALPYLEDLFTATQENVQLAVRDGHESVFVERLTGRRSVSVLTRVGGRFPLHGTGVGRALLAFAPPEVQREVLAGPLRRWTEHTVVDPAALAAELADVRARGVAVSDRQVTPDAVSVAAPVTGRDGTVVAAVSVVVRRGTAPPAALVPAVRTAALGISRALGGAEPRVPVSGSGAGRPGGGRAPWAGSTS